MPRPPRGIRGRTGALDHRARAPPRRTAAGPRRWWVACRSRNQSVTGCARTQVAQRTDPGGDAPIPAGMLPGGSDAAVTPARIKETRTLLRDPGHHPPMLSSATAGRVAAAASRAMPRDGRLFLKAEHLQKTGSFKPRAALARIQSMTAEERARGAITISAGNAGQAYAWAGREAHVPVTVVMPAGAVASKVAACREYGAEVVLHGTHVGESLLRLEELRVERGLTLVHPYDQPEVLLGNGSCGLEILEDLPDVDVVVVGVGGGGLIGGVAVALQESGPSARVGGVGPVGSEALTRGLEAGQPVQVRPVSVAAGLGAPVVGSLALDVAGRYLDGVVLVDDPTILGGLRFAL